MAIERTGVPERRCRTKAPVPNQSSVHCSVHSVVDTSVGNGVLRGSCDPAAGNVIDVLTLWVPVIRSQKSRRDAVLAAERG